MLDATDKKLLKLLQTDAKKTNKELSVKLGLSVTAIYERIRKLERNGVIDRYVALVDRAKVRKGFSVFCHIKLIQHSRDYIKVFEAKVAKLTEVLECYHVSGDYDYILKIVVDDMDAYREFMINKLTTIEYIGSTHSIFTIGEVKNTTIVEV
ncbi:Lrp/AsnC family transcriptional regulator, leucine-responsive regulatory protein [Zhouia amylolytica]|uniref:Transcriptional regulator, AsnC family n=2 Tax=Zhouia amylolytica TaxID=376730 RepID=W2UPA7_9FLAO|nr:Lrp/AsnC family transcriptional regulator [Zhouia amylolytica]ETN95823.1 transcriptional regulator, AsnC family [Zhouia amylolytica AD3]MCQ0112040.1 Lrp/AsnC family transcriptional regulator [Zhouia amylolytica]SFS54957.1 Lrp/AsnC family transcriptional regulator, leucine-responsive regulatory protein [Zhouia amylolytica]